MKKIKPPRKLPKNKKKGGKKDGKDDKGGNIIQEIATEVLFAGLGAIGMQSALNNQQQQVCTEMKDLKKGYQEYYTVAVDYIGGEQQKSKELLEKTNALRSQIKIAANELEYTKEEGEVNQLYQNFFLLVVFLIIAFVLYIKYTGLFAEEEITF